MFFPLFAAVALLFGLTLGDQPSDYRADAQKIINLATGDLKGDVYKRLAYFTDHFGPRLSGSPALENSIDWLLTQLAADGFENVAGEVVQVPRWVRGNESLTLLTPRRANLKILSLGTSVGTNGTIVEAEAVVVSNFTELQQLPDEVVRGKFVVFNQQCDWTAQPINCYGVSVAYRSNGASAAAKKGALAALVRSVTPFSMDTPHTGVQSYQPGVVKVPAVSITVEDADLLERLYRAGEKLVLQLRTEATSYGNVPSRNVVAELVGSTYPDQIVLVSGHIDSWDVGVGAMDDGGGAFVSWQVLRLVKRLGLRPKRTLRLVMWTCEEFGGIGSAQYFDRHNQKDLPNMALAMESDIGTFRPVGIAFTGSDKATTIMKQVAELLSPINASSLLPGGEGTDIDWWTEKGVPGASLATQNDKYFYFHHSQGDRMEVLNPDDMDLASATWAVAAYVVAMLDEMLPRN